MVLWIVLALMTGAAVLTVLWPLSNDRPREPETDTDRRFYRDQIAEIERDRARGALAEPEAEAARIEAGRRLLRSEAAAAGPRGSTAEPALRRRRAASALALSVVPIVGLAVYGVLGSPDLPARMVASQAAQEGAAPDLPTALARIEAHLATHPDDARGWDLVAPIYVRIGRTDDAARAYGSALRAGGETAERLLGRGEALVAAAQGIVTPDARTAFARALELDPVSPRGRFYVALAAEQDGDAAEAGRRYRELLADAGPDAPWAATVQARLAGLEVSGPATPLPAGEVTPAIAAMVEGLDTRLRDQGGTEPEWARLLRSLIVLGRRDEATDRLKRARAALASEPEAGARLDRLAADLGLIVVAGP